MTRTFEHKPAKRERVPMLVGLVGPSGSGKTKSALRLADGMVKATGGKVFVVDTEARRALHYADEHEFEHVPMDAPYSPLDYLAALEYCVAQGATVVIVDSASHEHEGPGGVLDMHDTFLDQKCGDDWKKRQRLTMSAWIEPKAQRRKLIGAVLRLGINGIFCFRAKEKIKLKPGKDPIQLGWQPIAGDEFVYEMLVNVFLPPGAKGVPNWAPDEPGEKVMLKLPEHLKGVFRAGKPLSEDTGEALAKWAAGENAAEPVPEFSPDLDAAVVEIQQSLTMAELDATSKRLAERTWSAADKVKLRDAVVGVREAWASESSEE